MTTIEEVVDWYIGTVYPEVQTSTTQSTTNTYSINVTTSNVELGYEDLPF